MKKLILLRQKTYRNFLWRKKYFFQRKENLTTKLKSSKSDESSESEIDEIKSELKQLQTEIAGFRDEMWTIEETSVFDFLSIPNCDNKSLQEDEILYQARNKGSKLITYKGYFILKRLTLSLW